MQLRSNENTFQLYGRIWDDDGIYIARQIQEIDGSYPVLNCHLNTIGGDVFAGNDIYKALLRTKSVLDIYVDGVAASMGAILMLPARKVYMTKSSLVMTHAPSAGLNGTADDFEKAAVLMRNLESQFLEKWAAKTGKPIKDLKPLLVGDNWLSAEVCLQMGLIDGIVDDVFEPLEIDALKDLKISAVLKGEDPLEKGLRENKEKHKPQAINNEESKTKNLTMKKDLIASFSFLSVAGITEASSDTKVIATMTSHIDDVQGQLATANAEIKALKDAEKVKAEAAIKAAVKTAHDAGKITAEQVPTYEGIGEKAGIEALNVTLSHLGARAPITPTLKPEGRVQPSDMTWDEYQEKNPRGLEALKTADRPAFEALFLAKYNTPYKE